MIMAGIELAIGIVIGLVLIGLVLSVGTGLIVGAIALAAHALKTLFQLITALTSGIGILIQNIAGLTLAIAWIPVVLLVWTLRRSGRWPKVCKGLTGVSQELKKAFLRCFRLEFAWKV